MRILRKCLDVKWHKIVVFLIVLLAEMNIYVFVYCIKLAIKIKLMTILLSWIINKVFPELKRIFYPRKSINNEIIEESFVDNSYMASVFLKPINFDIFDEFNTNNSQIMMNINVNILVAEECLNINTGMLSYVYRLNE